MDELPTALRNELKKAETPERVMQIRRGVEAMGGYEDVIKFAGEMLESLELKRKSAEAASSSDSIEIERKGGSTAEILKRTGLVDYRINEVAARAEAGIKSVTEASLDAKIGELEKPIGILNEQARELSSRIDISKAYLTLLAEKMKSGSRGAEDNTIDDKLKKLASMLPGGLIPTVQTCNEMVEQVNEIYSQISGLKAQLRKLLSLKKNEKPNAKNTNRVKDFLRRYF